MRGNIPPGVAMGAGGPYRAPTMVPMSGVPGLGSPLGVPSPFINIGNKANNGFNNPNRGGPNNQNNRRGPNSQNNRGFNNQNTGGFNSQNNRGFNSQNTGGFNSQNNRGFNSQNTGGFNSQSNRSFNSQNAGGFNNGYDFAMYPKNNNSEIIDSINAKIGQENNIVTLGPKQDDSYLYLKIKVPRNKEIQKNLLNLTGTSLIDDTNYYFSNIPKNEAKLSEQINSKFSTELLEGSRLNLSSLSDRFRIPPLDRYTVSFILFLCAIKAFSEKCEIKEINFENNAQTDTEGFTHVLQLFPDLEKVYYLGNPISNQNKNILRPFNTPRGSLRPNIELVREEPAAPSAIKTGWGNLAYQEVTNPYNIPLKRVIKGNIILSKRPKLVLSNFIPVSINPNDSPIHRFLLAFIDRGWTDLKNINAFYFENAVFSLTADICPDNSPLAKNYNESNLNRLFVENSANKIAVGPNNIKNMQLDLFGEGFYATLTSFDINIINDFICAIVCHGAFNKNYKDVDEIFCFDRSLLVGCEDENIFITNDHIFVRAPKLPGML